MSTAEKYLRPNVIAQVARLDLRAKFIVEGFLAGLHSSPFQGFSVEFSEHRKYSPGDDLKDLDWNVFAKTDRYYVKKFQAETNVTGYLVMDLSASMDWCGVREMEKAKVSGTQHLLSAASTEQERLTKFEYSICLAAALGYLMIYQQDPVGLVTCADKLRDVIQPKSKRTQLGNILALLANLKPAGQTDLAHGLHQLAAMIRSKSLIMIFSDLLTDPDELLKSLYHLRHRGNEIILFHVLDEAEVEFPFEGLVEFVDVESAEEMQLDAKGMREDYRRSVDEFRNRFKEESFKANIDYVPLHTGIGFDKALIEYLLSAPATVLVMSFFYTIRFWEVCGSLSVAAAACAVLGSFLVLRRMALLTDAIGHVLLLGIVLAFLITHDLKSPLLMLGAAATGLITVALVEAVSKSRFVKEDAAIGLVFPALFALGVILATYHARNTHLDVDRVLLGSPEMAPLNRASIGLYDLGPFSLLVMSLMFLLNAGFVIVLFKELKLSTFDAGLAFALGLAPTLLHYSLMGLVSLTAVTAFDAVGPVLVVAFFVVPPASAYLLTDRLSVMVPLGVCIGVAAAVTGTALANVMNTTIAGTVAVFMGAMFATILIASPRHGLIRMAMHRVRQRRNFFETMLAIHLYQHEGTPEEEKESRLDTLHEHVNWKQRDTLSVARRIVARDWATQELDRLRLTPQGRLEALAAIGPSNLQSVI